MDERALVLEMLIEVTQKGAYSHIVIRDALNKYDYLTHQEKAFIKRLFEGTLERMIQLDYCIDCVWEHIRFCIWTAYPNLRHATRRSNLRGKKVLQPSKAL